MPRIMISPRATSLLWMTLLSLSLCACTKPKPPPVDDPPEPQSVAHTELRDAIQAPLDKAKSVEQTMQDAAEAQRAEIDAQN